MSDASSPSVFLDPSGRRWRRVRGAILLFGIFSTLCAAVFIIVVVLPPILPALSGARPNRELGKAPAWAGSKARRVHLAARRKLFAALDRENPPPATRGAHLPLSTTTKPASVSPNNATELVHTDANAAPSVIAGFYVNWDDNSFSSLRTHAADLDWVICEWAFLEGQGDSLALAIDRRVLYVIERMASGDQPRVMLMLSNYNRQKQAFDESRLRKLLRSPESVRRISSALASAVSRYNLGGVAIDFEQIPDGASADLARLMASVRTALDSVHQAKVAIAGAKGVSRPLLIQAVAADASPVDLKRYNAVTDYTVLMAYDEHYGAGDAGPVASQSWYERKVNAAVAAIPANKLILAVGAYGYDWNDAKPRNSANEMTFQEVMSASRRSGKPIVFDDASRTPYLSWTDPDSTDHLVWFLDGATAYNEIAAGRQRGVAGHAIWRLGSEDPSLWSVIGGRTHDDPRKSLSEIPAGYDVEFDGAGDLLRLASQPRKGSREVVLDSVANRITKERMLVLPAPYIVSRIGGDANADSAESLTGSPPHGKKIVLTFDDGPDASWTAPILDTLRARHAPAAFFLIGKNALLHADLVQRIWREGHEIGNHTYTHPNLALVSPLVTRLELDATDRLLEALLNRRTAYFRPPYFGDADPTTSDELDPVGVATSLGYLTAGVHIDSEDWQQLSPAQITDTVLKQRDRGNVVLLHDGGGNRSNTVAALGPLIDSLRARGDTLVLLSGLIGLTRDQAMPRLPASSAMTRYAELAIFGGIGALEWGVFWLFAIAIILGLGRLTIITLLALWQRYRIRVVPAAASSTMLWPSVSVIVPSYNEQKVVVKTVRSLLQQQYDGPLDIVVVDDGSSDATYQTALDEFREYDRVTVLTKPNGGKASALNYGIAQARGDVVVGLDADTLFLPKTITCLVEPLRDESVGAVAGNAKVGNRVNLVTRWQAVEYVTSQNLDRRAFALLNCITVIPGAVGAWRRELVLRAGGFSNDTLAEDQDLTLAISRMGHRIAYAENAIAYTEAPDTFRGLAKQRFRWSFGTLQCMWKHRDALFRSKYGTLGMIAMPNVWLFQLLFAAISPLADLLFVWSLLSVWMTWREHGATYALTNLEQVVTFYAVFLLVDWVAAVIAFVMEPDEDRGLAWLIFLQRFAYRQVMYWVVVRSFVAALRGQIVGWGKLERKATVSVPAALIERDLRFRRWERFSNAVRAAVGRK